MEWLRLEEQQQAFANVAWTAVRELEALAALGVSARSLGKSSWRSPMRQDVRLSSRHERLAELVDDFRARGSSL